MKWHNWLFFVGLVLGTMNAAFAEQINCGTPPQLSPLLQNDESIKGALQSKAQFLSRLVGQAELGGQIEATKKEIYVQSKDYYPAQQEAYLNYLFCVIISSDTKLSTLEKLDALSKIRTPRPQSSNEPPSCTPAVLKTLKLPDVPTLDANGSHVGSLSGISVSIIQECPTPTKAEHKFHLDYGYYNGSGTWRGEQHLILVLKSSEGAGLKTETIPLDRSGCIYGGPQQRSADVVLGGGIANLISAAELTVSRVSGTQTGC